MDTNNGKRCDVSKTEIDILKAELRLLLRKVENMKEKLKDLESQYIPNYQDLSGNSDPCFSALRFAASETTVSATVPSENIEPATVPSGNIAPKTVASPTIPKSIKPTSTNCDCDEKPCEPIQFRDWISLKKTIICAIKNNYSTLNENKLKKEFMETCGEHGFRSSYSRLLYELVMQHALYERDFKSKQFGEKFVENLSTTEITQKDNFLQFYKDHRTPIWF